MKHIHPGVAGLLLIATLAGCGGGGASPSLADKGSTAPAPTDVPGVGGGGGSGGSGGGQTGGGSGGNSGGGVDPGGGVVVLPPAPGDDGATIVVPQPGQLDPKPVFVNGLLVNVDGRHVTARLSWYSGVEPCYVLDSVQTSQDGNTITLTPLEGHGPGDNICIEIALLKATVVDLGDLEPGTYVIQADPGDAAPVTIEVK